MPLWPRHRYLGPGNSVRSGHPYDADDAIAEKHDLLYEVNPERASEADALAVDEFVEDWQTNFNYHSLIGAVGLQAKRVVEGVTGQLYPSMKRHRGHDSYGYAQKRLSELYQAEKKKGTDTNWYEFQKLHLKDIFAEYAEQEQASKRQAVDESERDRADPSTSADADRRDAAVENPLSNISNFVNDTWDNAMANMDVETVETTANPSKGGGLGVGGGSAGSGAGRSGKANSTGMIISIPKNPSTPYHVKTYRKTWILFSYGFAHTIKEDGRNRKLYTPLSLIPVDLFPFYVDQAEFQGNFAQGLNVAVCARANVKTLGCRMNFQTAATKSQWATSEFVAIGQTAVGINLAMDGMNYKYTPSADKPMIIETHNNLNMDDFHEKLYGKDTWQGAISLVPRHLNAYWTAETAMIAPTLDPNTSFRHTNGGPKIDGAVDRFLINSAIGQPLINYEYIIKNGIITDQRSTDEVNELNAYVTASQCEPLKIVPIMNNDNPAKTIEGQVKLDRLVDTNMLTGWQNGFTSNYYQTLEMPLTYRWGSGHVHGNVQPQIHVGITAVPAINPGSENTDFQNTAVYWAIDCELTVHHYINSCYHHGSYMHTRAPNYYPAKHTKKYSNGFTKQHHPNVSDAHYSDAFGSVEDTRGIQRPQRTCSAPPLSAETGFNRQPQATAQKRVSNFTI